jgi:hypothetical protein
MRMSEMDYIKEGMKALQPGLPSPNHLGDIQNDMSSAERLGKFVEYIYSHHPALFEHAYKEACK